MTVLPWLTLSILGPSTSSTAMSSSSSSTTPDNSPSIYPNKGATAGAVVGGPVMLGLLAGTIVFLLHRGRKAKS